MSYLNSNFVSDFNKAIISLWFRAPLEALQRLTEFQTLKKGGVLPLLTFGKISKTYATLTESTGSSSYTITSYVTPGGACDWTPSHVDTQQVATGSMIVKGPEGDDIGPSYLGIYKKSADTGGGYGLVLFLLTGSTGDGTGFGQNRSTSNSSYGTGTPTGATLDCNVQIHFDFGSRTFRSDSVAPGNPRASTDVSTDDGGVALRGRGNDYYTALEGIAVKPDTWHHLLLSFDVSHATHGVSQHADSTNGDYGDTFSPTPASFSNPAKIWAALDDVNYSGNALRVPFGDTVGGFLGPNDFASNNVQYAAASGIGGSSRSAGWGVSGSWTDAFSSTEPIIFTASGALLPATPLGLPAAGNVVDHIRHIEMAEFQMWIGKTLDTSTESNRRVFIDYDHNSRIRVLKPVDPKQAEDLLNKPDILLHRSKNWIKGKNTGEGSELDPIGEIRKYKPEPSISSPF